MTGVGEVDNRDGAAPPPPPVFGPPPPPAFTGLPGGIGAGVAAGIAAAAVPLPLPTAETLAIPLRPRRLVGVALDLLTRQDSGLRSASFYIGFLALVTVGPAVALVAVGLAVGGDWATSAVPARQGAAAPPAWFWWLMLALLPATLGFVAVGVEAKALATAVIGGRAEGRPLQLRESIAVARARFWSVLGASLAVGVVSSIAQFGLLAVLGATLRSESAVGALDQAVSILVGVLIGAPFIYAPAGIVLGEASAAEALRRSIRLARARKGLALVVTLFAVLAGFVVQFGLGIAIDTVARLVSGVSFAENAPPALLLPLAAALVFAFGTLVLLTEAIAAAPAVHAFLALTHYTGGLERARRLPGPNGGLLDPWVTPGLALTGSAALLLLLGGLLALPWGG